MSRASLSPFAALLLSLVAPALGARTVTAAAPPAADARGPTAPILAWAECGDGFECATATLPLDHEKPRGATITVPLIRKPATAPDDRIGSLFLNPGGPGGSGVLFLRAAIGVFTDLNARFDIVSFDPRGIGAASPAVRCQTPAEIDALIADFPDVTSEPPQRILADAAAYGRRCRGTNGKILRHLSTADTARDLDLLRRAVGDERLTYLGFSNGTEIGSQYLRPGSRRAIHAPGSLPRAGR